MKQDFNLASGAVLHVSVPPFREALALLKAVTNATAGLPTADDVGRAVLTSPEAEAAIAKVFERCTYESVKLTLALFDDPAYTERLRRDYLEICSKIIEVTCAPFLERASSASNGSDPSPIAGHGSR
jgi:hypothetical protein